MKNQNNLNKNELIYIAGKITNEKDYELKFELAEKYLNNLGYKHIVNPVKLAKALPNYPNLSWKMYMSVCIGALEHCNAIAMLPNWKYSRGAIQERKIAEEMDIPILYLTQECFDKIKDMKTLENMKQQLNYMIRNEYCE